MEQAEQGAIDAEVYSRASRPKRALWLGRKFRQTIPSMPMYSGPGSPGVKSQESLPNHTAHGPIKDMCPARYRTAVQIPWGGALVWVNIWCKRDKYRTHWNGVSFARQLSESSVRS